VIHKFEENVNSLSLNSSPDGLVSREKLLGSSRSLLRTNPQALLHVPGVR